MGDSGKNKKKAGKKKQNKFSWRGGGGQFDYDDGQQIDLNNVDPSDVNARKQSFKQRFNMLGNSAKQKLGILAQKLQRNKQESKNKNSSSSHQYRNVLTSLDDETLIDEDDMGNNAIIEVASEDNRGSYQPPVQIPVQ